MSPTPGIVEPFLYSFLEGVRDSVMNHVSGGENQHLAFERVDHETNHAYNYKDTIITDR